MNSTLNLSFNFKPQKLSEVDLSLTFEFDL